MNNTYNTLLADTKKANDIFKPDFFRLTKTEDKDKFNTLLQSGAFFLYDEIFDQLKELIKSRNPSSSFNADDYIRLVDKHLNGCSIAEYGVWVYYPWSGRMVHILDEAEFIELRTAANKNKITIAERSILAAKKVGVIGLSVGQSVSLTLAMERGCGELRLADFDTLELNNLNRIRTGVHNLGLLKAYSVAREIAEIDPFFKVVCFTEGITEGNINSFFLDGGKLDAVIDECDGVNIKILCRIKAKELHVPVLMEASDRGTLDVERFDLNPDMPIMHGWLEHLALDFDVLRNLKTNEEKVPYMLPISGLDTLSSRMKASMIEIRNTITTWPQLATAVTLGGALTADTCRRIFLGQFTNSGRYFIDLENLVPDTRPKIHFEPEASLTLTEASMQEMAGKVLQNLDPAGISLEASDINGLVNAAIKAPSASNSQPWKWYFWQGYLFLFFEDTGIVSFGDFEHIASHIAHGAAIENLQLEAHRKGIQTQIHLFPLAQEPRLVAAIQFGTTGKSAGLYRPDELVNYIDERLTNRNAGTKQGIASSILEQLTEAVRSFPGADLIIKDSPEEINILSGIIGPSERLKLLNPASHYEFFQKEIRWNDEESNAAKDGVNINSLGISQQEEIALKMIKNPEAVKLLAEWKGGQAIEYTARKAIATASAFGLITMPDFSPANYVSGGMAMERMWLTATKYSISIQPMMAPVLCFARLNNGAGSGIPDFMREEYKQLYQRFNDLFPNIENKGKILLFKLSITETPPVRSYRKLPGDVLLFGDSKG